jgi:hypothetical protein
MRRPRSGQQELNLREILARGEKEIEEGIGYDLDAVFADADDLLEQMPQKDKQRRTK